MAIPHIVAEEIVKFLRQAPTRTFQQRMKQRNAIEGTHSELVRGHSRKIPPQSNSPISKRGVLQQNHYSLFRTAHSMVRGGGSAPIIQPSESSGLAWYLMVI